MLGIGIGVRGVMGKGWGARVGIRVHGVMGMGCQAGHGGPWGGGDGDRVPRVEIGVPWGDGHGDGVLGMEMWVLDL